MILFISILLVLALVVTLFMLHPKFGAKSKGKRLETIVASPNYQHGKFVNRTFTPSLTEGHSMSKVMVDFLFNKPPRSKPRNQIPTVETNLKALPEGDWLV